MEGDHIFRKYIIIVQIMYKYQFKPVMWKIFWELRTVECNVAGV